MWGRSQSVWATGSMSGRGSVSPGVLQCVDGLLPCMTLLLVMALDGDEDEHEGQRAEDERLHERQHDLEPVQGDGDEGHEETGHDAQRHLATEDIAKESHRQRDRLD